MAEQSRWSRPLLAVICLLALALPIYYWGSLLSWDFNNLNSETIFPLLGLLAFSIIWLQLAFQSIASHFSAQFQRVFFGWSGWIFLLLIIAHPLLLGLTLSQVSGEFSLGDLDDYVSKDLEPYVKIAMVAWLIFIGYELVSRLKRWSWYEKALSIYRYFNYAAFYLILVHSLVLGTHLQESSLRAVWYFYAVSGTIFILQDLFGKKLTSSNSGVSL